jgi:hypothetical protein
MESISSSFVCVPIGVAVYNELVLRVGDPNKDVARLVEHAVQSFLDRTADNDWSDAYAAWKQHSRPDAEFRTRFGNPDNGYYWTPLFLPNGTKIAMAYGGRTDEAEIRHEKIVLGDKIIPSPSLLASTIANGTSRNAWRDLRIKRPADLEFRLADELRREGARK